MYHWSLVSFLKSATQIVLAESRQANFYCIAYVTFVYKYTVSRA